MQQAERQPSSVNYPSDGGYTRPLLGIVLSQEAKLDDALEKIRTFVSASRVLSASLIDPADDSPHVVGAIADAAALMASLAESILDQMGDRRFDRPAAVSTS